MEPKMSTLLNEFSVKTDNIKSLRDVALEFIREAIIIRQFKPGDQLNERELSEMMGISTTPIKEALRVLTHDGLVKTVPRKGTFVSELIDTSIEDFMILKAPLEGLASRLAALKSTDEELKQLGLQVELMEKSVKAEDKEQLMIENTKFHNLIRDFAKHPMMLQLFKNIASFDLAFRKRTYLVHVEIEKGFLDHKRIYEAIKQRDPDLAEKRMKEHIMRSVENVLKNN